MPDQSIIRATTLNCIDFQIHSANCYAEARKWTDGGDRYAPRVRHFQESAAKLAAEARMRLFQLIGSED